MMGLPVHELILYVRVFRYDTLQNAFRNIPVDGAEIYTSNTYSNSYAYNFTLNFNPSIHIYLSWMDSGSKMLPLATQAKCVETS
jgi:hypothetical protein